MKALSLWQPWAELVVSGRKTIELRSWNTKFRGTFYIHASKREMMADVKRFDLTRAQLDFGALIGKANMVDVKRYTDKLEFLADGPLHLALDFYENDEDRWIRVALLRDWTLATLGESEWD